MNFSKEKILQNNKICFAIFLVFMVAFTIASCVSGESKAINIVKKGNFYDYPDITVGEAVDNFFENPKWEVGIPVDESLADYKLVNCKGKITYDGSIVNAEIQFIVDEDDKEFQMNAFEINGVPQSSYMANSLIEAMCE